jgi:hypothetical protein
MLARILAAAVIAHSVVGGAGVSARQLDANEANPAGRG